MMHRVLGMITCGACATSAFTFPVSSIRVDATAQTTSNSNNVACSRWVGQADHVGASVGNGRRAVAKTPALGSLSMSAEGGGEDIQQSRRGLIAGFGKAASAAVAAAALSSVVSPREAAAIGPVKMLLTEPEYHSVTCPPKTQVPGEKAGAGLKPICVNVSVTANNPTPKEIIDAAVFGFVYDEENTSVVANNPDGASDAGQFAIIDKVPPGSSRVSFQFVAAIEPGEDFELKKLKFTSLKAISYPGGQRYGAITECEMNPLAEECGFD